MLIWLRMETWKSRHQCLQTAKWKHPARLEEEDTDGQGCWHFARLLLSCLPAGWRVPEEQSVGPAAFQPDEPIAVPSSSLCSGSTAALVWICGFFLSLLITTFSDRWSHMWPQQLPGVSPLLRVPSCVTAQFSSSPTPVAQSSPYLPANGKAVHVQLVYSCHRCEMWQPTDHATSTAPDSWTSSPVSDQWSKPPGSSPSSEDMLKVGCGKPPKDIES